MGLLPISKTESITGGKMKRILISVMAATMVAGAFAFDRASFTPAGSLSNYTKTDYNIVSKFGSTYRSVAVKYVHDYNAAGLETVCTGYNAKNALVDKITYEYNEKRLLVSSTFFDAQNTMIWKTTLEYDTSNRLTSESEFDKDNRLSGKTIYEYNDKEVSKGKEAKVIESYYDGNGKLLVRAISTMNPAGKPAEICRYYGDGSLDRKEVYSYNDYGVLSQVEYVEPDGKIKTKIVYRYDASKGYLTEIDTYNANSVLYQREIYKNDTKGNPTSVSVYFVSEKFGGTLNELQQQSAYTYTYN